jgi:glycosyltransferase involved in cell wall biosynthesis
MPLDIGRGSVASRLGQQVDILVLALASIPRLPLLGEDQRLFAGGDVRTVNIINHLPPSDANLLLITTRFGARLFKRAIRVRTAFVEVGLPADFRSTSSIVTIVQHLLNAVEATLFILKQGRRTSDAIAYSSSAILSDVLSASLCRGLKRVRKWVAVVHHLPPSRRDPYSSWLEGQVSGLSGRVSAALIARFADTVIANNSAVAARLREAGLSSTRVFLNGNGVEADSIKSIARSVLTRQPHSATYVGRLSRQKGVLDLIRIWQAVVRRLPDAMLTVIGEQDNLTTQDVREEAEKSGIGGNVRVRGPVDRTELIRTVAGSSVFVNPSYVEGWSIATMESLVCRTPVVAWDLPEYAEIYGDAVLRVRLPELDSFSDAVVRVLADDSIRHELLRHAESLPASYSWGAIARREWQLILGS